MKTILILGLVGLVFGGGRVVLVWRRSQQKNRELRCQAVAQMRAVYGWSEAEALQAIAALRTSGVSEAEAIHEILGGKSNTG